MKNYEDREELHNQIMSGVNKLADYVASTMGPRGRTVIIQQAGRAPIVTKDGVSVARFVDLDNPFQNAAVQIIKQAAEETNSSAGDGTTTSTVLARAILKEAYKYIAAGYSPIEVKRGIDMSVSALLERLREEAKPISSVEDIVSIATISANGDDTVGRLIGEAVESIGKDGSITIKEGGAMETTLEVVDGFRMDSGLASAKFITNTKLNIMKHKEPHFLITDATIDKVEQIMPALEIAARLKKPLIIVADEVLDEALAALIANAVRGTLKVASIKAPSYGDERKEILSDLAVAVGATFFSEDRDDERTIESVKLADFGKADSIESSKYKTTIVNGYGKVDEIQDRIESIDAEIQEVDDFRVCEKLQARITRLASSVAIIHVGGNTEVEMIERKHRIEDALEAVRSAQAEGLTEGAGKALLRSRAVLDLVEVKHPEQRAGVDLMKKVCEAPIRQILENSGESADLIISEIEKEKCVHVYDLVNKAYVDAYEAGIIDPVKVTCCALQNAASAAGTLITSNYAIIETS